MPALEPIATALTGWFAANARDLPWRRSQDPYGIWISEVMLQQTQVQTVIPYWERWMRELPDVAALAATSMERLLKLWEGLGYYHRARNVYKAAQIIVREHGGVVPSGHSTLLALPGIGPYTAGAICSIAFNQPAAILDGNVMRVLTRLFGIGGDVRLRSVNARLWKIAQQLVNAAAASEESLPRPCGSLNQALMELGAILCTPRQPECGACPVKGFCVAQRRGTMDRLPHAGKRQQTVRRHLLAFVVRRHGRVLVRQRPEGGVNGRFWEFPNCEINGTAVDVQQHLRALGLEWRPHSTKRLCTVHHTITRFRLRIDAYEVIAARAVRLQAPGQWRTLSQLDQLALAGPHRKILAALQTGRGRVRQKGISC